MRIGVSSSGPMGALVGRVCCSWPGFVWRMLGRSRLKSPFASRARSAKWSSRPQPRRRPPTTNTTMRQHAGLAIRCTFAVSSRDGEKGEARTLPLSKPRCAGAFQRIQATLEAAGANFDDVVMLNTVHVWQSGRARTSKGTDTRNSRRSAGSRRIHKSAVLGLDGSGNDRAHPRHRYCRDPSHCPS